MASSDKPKLPGFGGMGGFKLDLSKAKEETATYDKVRIERSEAMGKFERGFGMPVVHAFESNRKGSVKIEEIIEKVPVREQPEMKMDPLKYNLPVQANQVSPPNALSKSHTFEFRDEHVVPPEYLLKAKEMPMKPIERRDKPGRSGGVRGNQEPLKLKTKQAWTSEMGDTIPNSGFEIRKKIWYEGQREHEHSGAKFDLFKMRVSKQPSAVSIDYQGKTHTTAPGGGHRKKHHLFVGVGHDKRIVTAKTRRGLIDAFGKT